MENILFQQSQFQRVLNDHNIRNNLTIVKTTRGESFYQNLSLKFFKFHNMPVVFEEQVKRDDQSEN